MQIILKVSSSTIEQIGKAVNRSDGPSLYVSILSKLLNDNPRPEAVLFFCLTVLTVGRDGDKQEKQWLNELCQAIVLVPDDTGSTTVLLR